MELLKLALLRFTESQVEKFAHILNRNRITFNELRQNPDLQPAIAILIEREAPPFYTTQSQPRAGLFFAKKDRGEVRSG